MAFLILVARGSALATVANVMAVSEAYDHFVAGLALVDSTTAPLLAVQ
jgi:hypothetical protein